MVPWRRDLFDSGGYVLALILGFFMGMLLWDLYGNVVIFKSICDGQKVSATIPIHICVYRRNEIQSDNSDQTAKSIG
jgi:hypothetical protein